jgi:aspartyl/asparaginyl beta-hydroxylase (cupin superfamily)
MSLSTRAIEPDKYFLKESRYVGTHPEFYDTAMFPWVKDLESNYKLILDEIEGLLIGGEEMPPNLNPPYLSSPDAWRNFYFFNFRWYNHKNCLKYPKTWALIQSIPNISFAGITVLEAHSKVLPHIGETNAIIRCHLGLKIPGQYLDCGIKVGDKQCGYHEGKLLMFSDAHFHTTWNNTDERRFIVVLDVIQPEFAYKGNWICANSLAALTIKFMDEKISLIKPLPDFILKIMLKTLAVAWYLFLPIQKRFSIFYK